MRIKTKHKGFTLMEVLIAAGILAMGFMLIAGAFPLGIKLTTIATERTIAVVAEEEALAKVKLYGVDTASLGTAGFVSFNRSMLAPGTLFALQSQGFSDSEIDELLLDESLYPSISKADLSPDTHKYHWSALLRETGTGGVQTIIFVSRKAGAGAKYLYFDETAGAWGLVDWPEPVKVDVTQLDTRRLRIEPPTTALPSPYSIESFINEGSEIVDDGTGDIYQVLERDRNNPDQIVLTTDWNGGSDVWVVPPAAGSGRYPCVRVSSH